MHPVNCCNHTRSRPCSILDSGPCIFAPFFYISRRRDGDAADTSVPEAPQKQGRLHHSHRNRLNSSVEASFTINGQVVRGVPHLGRLVVKDGELSLTHTTCEISRNRPVWECLKFFLRPAVGPPSRRLRVRLTTELGGDEGFAL